MQSAIYSSTRGDYNSRPSVKNPYKSRIARQLYTYVCSASWPLCGVQAYTEFQSGKTGPNSD